MSLTLLKDGGTWDFLASTFMIKISTFERLIVGFLMKISEDVLKVFVSNFAIGYPMHKVQSDNSRFETFPFTAEATDVTLHHTNRPSGNHQEAKIYFRGKKHLYDYKIEVSVRPNGFASGYSGHFSGAGSYLNILTERIGKHK